MLCGPKPGWTAWTVLTESAAETAIAPTEAAEYAVAPAESAGSAEAANLAETTAESIVDVRVAQNQTSLLLLKKFSSNCSVCAGSIIRQGDCYIHRKYAPVLCRRCRSLITEIQRCCAKALARKFAEVGGGVCPLHRAGGTRIPAKYRKHRPDLRRDGSDPPSGETPGLLPEDRYVKRAGLDYWDRVRLHIHDSFEELAASFPGGRFFVPPRRRIHPTRIFHSGMGISWSSERRRRDFLPVSWSVIGTPACAYRCFPKPVPQPVQRGGHCSLRSAAPKWVSRSGIKSLNEIVPK